MHSRAIPIMAALLMAAGLATPSPAALPTGASPLTLISAPALSPDGESVVFECAQDLWVAPAVGGEARLLVGGPARDAYPRFTPDGKRVVFSSERTGSMQVFSVPLEGGDALQHTHHTEGNRLECLSPDGTRALVRGLREIPGSRSPRLMEIDLTAERREMRLFDASGHSASWSPDGARVLFCRGGELSFRKGYHGSRASQIWLYQMDGGHFENPIHGVTEAASPMWLPDGRGFYFVSNSGGTSNLWIKRDGSPPEQITHYQGDGVITPDLSKDGGTLVFRLGLEVLRFRPAVDANPTPVNFWTREPLPDVSSEKRKISGTTDADFSMDLKQLVFSAAGELWWIPKAGEPAQRLTESAASETDVHFSPDGESLYFLRDDGLQASYVRARLRGGQLQDEQAVTGGERSKSRFQISPDGSMIAWLEGTGDLHVADANGRNPRCLFGCWDKPTFDWSPDGRWIAFAAKGADSNRDLWIVDSDGKSDPLNLTRHPGFEGSPRWSPDGRWLVFSGRRDATGETRLWRIDFGKNGPSREMTAAEALALGDAAEMVSTRGIEPIRVIWSPDSRSIWFQSRTDFSNKLYSVGVDGRGMETLADRRGIPIRVAADGTLLWRVDRTPETFSAGKSIPFPISTTVERPRGEILRLGFRLIWRRLGESFYQEEMNDCDWPKIRIKYESAAATARSSRQFDRVVSQLLGELNASHLAFARRPWNDERLKLPKEEPTAFPGFLFDDVVASEHAPLRIRSVLAGSPAARLEGGPVAGDVVLKIAGKPVNHGSAVDRFFQGAADRPLPVVLRAPDGRERVISLRCISYQQARTLYQAERLASARRQVAEADKGFAYLPVPSMSSGSLADLQLQVYRASVSSTGLILDLRDNGGGREADRMLAMFTQPVHSFTIPRNGPRGYPVDRLPSPVWNGPLVVICNQNTYSNAEIFCHAVQETARAPLVGVATAGGVISAISTTIPDVGDLQVPFRGWYLARNGENLDLNGAKPDHPVPMTPDDEVSGSDPQLAKAIAVLQSHP